MKRHASLVVVGGGMAAARLISRLEQLGHSHSIAVICEEPWFGYNRVLLPGYLGKSNALVELFQEETKKESLSIITGNPAMSIDPANRIIRLRDGVMTYETLVLATGSTVPMPKCLSKPLGNVVSLRSITDADRILQLTESAKSAVVLGGGLLGLESASAIAKLGAEVTVVHRNDHILNRQLNHGASLALAEQLERRGLSFKLGSEIVEVHSSDGIATAVELNNGERLTADFILLATGTTPNTTLARTAGVRCDYGVIVDNQLRTSVSNIYAVGECAEHLGSTCGLVAPVYEQADVLAEHLCGSYREYQPVSAPVRLKVDGVALFSAGDVNADGDEAVITSDTTTLYRRLTFQDDQLTSAILLGDTCGSANIQRYLNQPVIGAKQREQLLFGSFGE